MLAPKVNRAGPGSAPHAVGAAVDAQGAAACHPYCGIQNHSRSGQGEMGYVIQGYGWSHVDLIICGATAGFSAVVFSFDLLIAPPPEQLSLLFSGVWVKLTLQSVVTGPVVYSAPFQLLPTGQLPPVVSVR